METRWEGLRCFECLTEIVATDRRFAVLKALRLGDRVPAAMVHFNLTQEVVCAACAGWDPEAVEITE